MKNDKTFFDRGEKVDPIKVAREIAIKHGASTDDNFLDYIIWTYTGWPGFWDGDPLECFKTQLEEFFWTRKKGDEHG